MSTPRQTRSSTRTTASITTNPPSMPEQKASSRSMSRKRQKRSARDPSSSDLSLPSEPPLTPPSKRTKLVVGKTNPGTLNPGRLEIVDMPPPATPLPRPAEPHTTSATLTTPHGSRYTSYPLPDSTSPSKINSSELPRPTSTTATLLKEACAHLIATEPKLAPVIAKHPCHVFSPLGLAEEVDPFSTLASGIIAQQVSGAAANSIKRKFIGLFHPPPLEGEEQKALAFPPPASVAQTTIPRLREAGLSQRKAEYIQGLAEKFASGELGAKMLIEAPYEEVVEKLTAVRGLGRWSVEMFACFGLKRMDVFSVGDLGVQRGLAALLGKDVKKLKGKGGGKWKYLSEKEMLEHSAKFEPYRSVLMWYLWRIEDVNVAAIENN